MSLRCGRVRALMIAAVGGHATDAERLDIEVHLDGCARCRAERGLTEALRRLKSAEPAALSDAARERVRRAALNATALPAAREPRRRWLPELLVTASLATIAATLIIATRPAPSRIVQGDVQSTPAGGRAIADGARLTSTHGGRVLLGGPAVELAPGTVLVWNAVARTVTLERGAVTVDVDPRQGQPFRVATARFSVEVLGTRFTVDLDGVKTERGKVRVLDADRRPLDVVAAGQTWTVPASRPAAAAPTPAPTIPTTGAMPPRAVRRAPSGLGDQERLAQARQALARGDTTSARGLIEPLLRAPRRVAVEARSLEAESFLVEGRYDVAIERYLAVAGTFAGTPQAESALYAAAQLAGEAGRRDDAVRMLTRYLERYPSGRFTREARDRLERLTASGVR